MLLGVDVGGTFTDAVLLADDGTIHSAKAPSTPHAQEQGVMTAIEAVIEASRRPPPRARGGPDFGHCPTCPTHDQVSAPSATQTAHTAHAPETAYAGQTTDTSHAGQIERWAHGMTVATNALIEGRGARAALIVTDGFTDIVELGRQTRPSLYRLCEAGPEPLVPPELRFGAAERMGMDGPLRALDEGATETLVERLVAAEPEAVAVVLLHSYAHPQHERRIGELIAERLPGVHLSLSHELVGTLREYERAATTEVDAALSPLLAAYLGRLGDQAARRGLPAVQVMQSSGGLTDARRAAGHAALTVLSGPAGGVGGALLMSEAMGKSDVLCFDMGGTSCDVCVIEGGRVAETAQRSVAGRPLALPALDIHTVGAGGGSIAWRDPGGALRVGPESAGAEPGPACYGRGGERASVTDANLVLGRLLVDEPLAGGVTLDREAAERAVGRLARELGIGSIACAEGIVKVAEAEMRRALAVMTVERGIDPRRFALMPFGGAGPLHAASMAAELGIELVLCPRACGVLSALGLAAAAPRRDASATVMLTGESLTSENIERELRRLIERATAELDPCSASPHDGGRAHGGRRPNGPAARLGVRYELRYRGQSFELTVDGEIDPEDCFLDEMFVPVSDAPAAGEHALLNPARLREAFEEAHEQRYGYRDEDAEVELVNVRVSAVGPRPAVRLTSACADPPVRGSTIVVFDGEPTETELWRGELRAGTRVCGPALCAMDESTLLVPPGWSGSVDEHGTVALERERAEIERERAGRVNDGSVRADWERAE
jgi:N-methylhydantoinase A